MVQNRNSRVNGGRIEGTFPIWEINGDTKMKNISPSFLPHFHGLTTEYPGTFLFQVEKCNGNGSVLIKTIDNEVIPMLVNGHRLKVYKEPLSK